MIRHASSAVVWRAASLFAVGPWRRMRERVAATWRRVCLCLVMAIAVASCHDEPTSGLSDGTVQGLPALVAGVVDTGRVIPGGTNTFAITLPSTQRARLFLQATSGRGADTLVAELAEMTKVQQVSASVMSVGTDTSLDDQVSGALGLQDSTTYVVTVRGVGADDAGPYRVLLRLTDPRPESRAETIAVGDTITESIDQYGDIDEFSFDGTVGEEVIIFFQALQEQRPGTGLTLTLTDSTARTQIRSFDSDGGEGALESVSSWRLKLASTGRYGIRIEGLPYFGAGARNGRGPYRFLVYPIRRAPEGAPGTVAIGDTVAEAIDAVGDIDEFTFDGTAGQQVNVNLQILDGLSSGVTLQVWHGEEHQASVQTKVQGALDDNGTGRFTLPATGKYTVRLYSVEEGAPDSAAGHYRFEIYPVDRSPEAVPATVSIGDTLTGEAIDRPGDLDEFTFTGVQGEQLVVFFDLVDSTSSRMLRLEVIAPDGATTVASAWVGLPGDYTPAASARFTMSAAGTYTLRVYGLGVNVGAYSMELYHVDPAPEVLASTVPLSTWVTGESIDRPGDVDAYTFDATAGQLILLRIQAEPGSSGGFYLLSDLLWGTTTSQYSSHRIRMPETRTYSIQISGFLLGGSEYGVGPYRFMVYAANPAPETADAAYAIGDTIENESIDLPGDYDEFTFAATAGDSLDLYFDATDGSVERSFVIKVQNARTGETIIAAESTTYDSDIGTFVVPSTDSYRVMIDGWQTNTTGDVLPAVVGPYRFAITPHE